MTPSSAAPTSTMYTFKSEAAMRSTVFLNGQVLVTDTGTANGQQFSIPNPNGLQIAPGLADLAAKLNAFDNKGLLKAGAKMGIEGGKAFVEFEGKRETSTLHAITDPDFGRIDNNGDVLGLDDVGAGSFNPAGYTDDNDMNDAVFTRGGAAKPLDNGLSPQGRRKPVKPLDQALPADTLAPPKKPAPLAMSDAAVLPGTNTQPWKQTGTGTQPLQTVKNAPGTNPFAEMDVKTLTNLIATVVQAALDTALNQVKTQTVSSTILLEQEMGTFGDKPAVFSLGSINQHELPQGLVAATGVS